MARNPKVTKKTSGSGPRQADSRGRVRRGRPKVCRFCSDKTEWVDYKDVDLLRRFMNDRGRIRARGATGTCAQHQRDVAAAIKTARELALLPYALRTMAADPGGRRGGGRRGRDEAPAAAESGTSGVAVDTAEPDSDDVDADVEDEALVSDAPASADDVAGGAADDDTETA